MEIKITKRRKLLEVNNDMCHNFYYLINGRIINDAETHYRPFKFVLWFDTEDFFEVYDEMNNENFNCYLDDMIFGYTGLIKSYTDCKDFYEACKESIDRWNGDMCA